METDTTTKVDIVTFQPAYAKHFADINYGWLNEFFEVERHDQKLLDNPVTEIMDKGGQILFALIDGKVVGTTALIPERDGVYELAKMGVYPEYRGLKIGKKLMVAAIDYAREQGWKSLVLESNTKLAPALNLYISVGFRPVDLDPESPYTRCNIRMELDLK